MPKYYPAFQEKLPRVDGKVFLITGTTSGTGFVAAQCVAKKGGTAVLLNRTSQRQVDALAKLQAAVPDGTFVSVACDLQDFASVKQAVKEIQSKYNKIYCLSCNAGIMMANDEATVDGCDVQMQTNHLSHFLLTKELFPLLEKEAKESGDARVVFHSSGARNITKDGLEEKYFQKTGGNLGGDKPFSVLSGPPMIRYAQTKLANSVMMYAMHEKLQAKGSKVRAIACHPGLSSTGLGDSFLGKLPFYQRWTLKITGPAIIQTPEDGALGLLTGMMAEDAESGVLYGPKNSRFYGPDVPNPPEDFENNPETMSMLWKTSEETVGVKFNI